MRVNKHLLKALKFGALGGVLFGLVSFAVFSTESCYYMYLRFLLGWPGYIVGSILNIPHSYFESRFAVIAFLASVNGVFGALTFFFGAWSRAFKKGDSDE